MAPSPTGNVHVGNARTALFNFLFARSHGGAFVLRIDDTDGERNRPEYESGLLDGFHWLGLEWDEGPDLGGPNGPYRQSERLDIYRDHWTRLLNQGAAYHCFCTPAELDFERKAAEAEHRAYVYSRRCLTSPPAGRSAFTVRFKIPGGRVEFDDLVRGPVSFDSDLIGDPIIVKSDGGPTYNFASPIDDALLGITHVIRAEEHLSNTPGQLLILDALGYPRPHALAHLPLILAPDRTKLSKRRHDFAFLAQFKQWGYLPEAMVNYLALLGWNPGSEREIFSLPELISAFDMSRVQKSPAVFDLEKLNWFNGEYIRSLPDEDLAQRLAHFLPNLAPRLLPLAVRGLKERIVRLDEATAMLAYLAQPPLPPVLDEPGQQMIVATLAALGDADWEPDIIENVLHQVQENNGWSKGKFFGTLRAVVAQKVAPPIHYTFALLPKDEALSRLKMALR
jgi:nondiscriminating glutamyl-tRNA synthetase